MAIGISLWMLRVRFPVAPTAKFRHYSPYPIPVIPAVRQRHRPGNDPFFHWRTGGVQVVLDAVRLFLTLARGQLAAFAAQAGFNGDHFAFRLSLTIS
jgi:hypothetical protein